MEHKHFFKLQPSETAIFQAAAQIFSGYVAAGVVSEEEESKYLGKATSQSLALARSIENLVQSDDEASSRV